MEMRVVGVSVMVEKGAHLLLRLAAWRCGVKREEVARQRLTE